jgi:hypothetical protein
VLSAVFLYGMVWRCQVRMAVLQGDVAASVRRPLISYLYIPTLKMYMHVCQSIIQWGMFLLCSPGWSHARSGLLNN